MSHPLTKEAKAAIAALQPQQINAVYIGKRGRCCCGCNGTHYRRKSHGSICAEALQTLQARAKTAKSATQRLVRQQVLVGYNHYAFHTEENGEPMQVVLYPQDALAPTRLGLRSNY